jgi:hypothetical protein
LADRVGVDSTLNPDVNHPKTSFMKQNIFFATITLLNMAFLFHFATDKQQQSPADLPNIRASSIELVDSKGISRALLTAEPDGETVFRLRDADGTIRVKLGGSREGSGLLLLNDKTDPGFHVLAKSSGTSVTMIDKSGQKKTINALQYP